MRIPFWVIITIIVISIMTIVGVWLGAEFAFGADVDGGCLTKAQAQTRYPRQWLYWHGVGHCWDNRPGRRAAVRAPPPTPDANGNAPHHGRTPLQTDYIGPSVAYPSLMGGGGTDDTMLRGEAMTLWPLIADFDTDPPAFIPWQKRIALELK
jgi:hypothetical protein